MGQRPSADQRRAALREPARTTPCAVGSRLPSPRARDDRGSVTRAGRLSAHGARASLCRQGTTHRGPRARGDRAGDCAVAGALGAILHVSQAAARGRLRSGRRQVETSAARALRRQAARARLRACQAGAAADAVAGAPRVFPAGRAPRVRGDRSLRRPDGRTRSAFPATRRIRTRCSWASPIRAR